MENKIPTFTEQHKIALIQAFGIGIEKGLYEIPSDPKIHKNDIAHFKQFAICYSPEAERYYVKYYTKLKQKPSIVVIDGEFQNELYEYHKRIKDLQVTGAPEVQKSDVETHFQEFLLSTMGEELEVKPE